MEGSVLEPQGTQKNDRAWEIGDSLHPSRLDGSGPILVAIIHVGKDFSVSGDVLEKERAPSPSAVVVPSTQQVSTVVLNWNGAGETIACVRSLLAAGAAPGSIIVVDNGSEDNSVAVLRAELGDAARLLESPVNLGFAGGVNLGIQAALDDGADWVLLINNDTRADANFYRTLLEGAQAHPDYAILAPLILYHDRPDRIWSLGDRLIPGTLITRSLHRNRQVPERLPSFVPVDFLNACCLLVRRDVFETIGLFDPAYFMYGEDVDFCWRARRAGFLLGCVTTARIWHKVSWSTSPTSPQTRRWRMVNQIRFYRSAARGPQKTLMWAFTLVRAVLLAARNAGGGRRSLAVATLQAWWEGWRMSAETEGN